MTSAFKSIFLPFCNNIISGTAGSQVTWTVLLLIITPVLSADEHTVILKVFPEECALRIDNREADVSPSGNGYGMVTVSEGNHSLSLSMAGYVSKTVFFQAYSGTTFIEEKLEKEDSPFLLFAELRTGNQPKSVIFTPDGNYIMTALLDGRGIDVFSTTSYEKITTLEPPARYAELRGFVEMAVLPGKHQLWVSQMTTGYIHVFDLFSLQYLRSIDTKGTWPKVILPTEDEQVVYVSNWLSGTVSVIDAETMETVSTIPVDGTPRGLELTLDERYLYVCLYDNGSIQKIDLQQEKTVATLDFGGGSKRHILRHPEGDIFFVSDMYSGYIYKFSGTDDTLLLQTRVGHNPNTIDISPDGRYLYVSTRGPNNPETYLKKGYVFGKVLRLDTATLEIRDWIWGRNQPTGLAVSSDETFLAYSNFLDHSVEVYRILEPED